jgi:glucose/mannose-6-phosphate isomerase
MNLNDPETFRTIDRENMLAHIDSLPDQLHTAWDLGSQLPLPAWDEVRQVIVAGIGGSAIGADLVRAYIQPECRVPFVIHRDYDLPAWAWGKHTLVIASSHSGDTEETLSACRSAQEVGCRLLAVCTGGELAEFAQKTGAPVWRFDHTGQPRTAVGFSFGLLLAALFRLGLVPDPEAEILDAVRAMKAQQVHLRAGVPDIHNPAKRYAGQLVNRWVAVIGAEILAPVARRWKGQISEVAKAWAQFEDIPEADHNTLAGILNPEPLLPNLAAIFLRAARTLPRNQQRIELTRQIFMLQGIATDFYEAQGDTRLANQWTALLFGDYVSYYLAMAYGVDPTPIESIMAFKRQLRETD